MPDDDVPILCPVRGPYAFVPCPEGEISPLVDHLRANVPVAGPVTFPRGTVLPDGRVDLCKQSLGPAGCRRVVEALASNDHVRSLLLGTDGIGDAGAADVGDLLRSNPRLQVVYLGCNGITSAGAETLADSLAGNTRVEGLWLKRNPVGDGGARAIARLLAENRSLRVLDLVNTGLGHAGVEALCEALARPDCPVERLYLGGNFLDASDARRLADVLRVNGRLRSLLLNVGRLGDAGAIALAEGLRPNTGLRELGLASNGISAAGAETLFAAVTGHSSLTFLDLGYSPSTKVLGAAANAIGDAGGEQAARMLAGNGVLRDLDLTRTGIGEFGRGLIEFALRGNRTLTRCTIDGGWSETTRARLLANRQSVGADVAPSPEVTLIRSVYRTAR